MRRTYEKGAKASALKVLMAILQNSCALMKLPSSLALAKVLARSSEGMAQPGEMPCRREATRSAPPAWYGVHPVAAIAGDQLTSLTSS